MTPAETLLAKLPGAVPSGKGWAAKCPAHKDRRASLSVAEGDDGRALVRCHAGCTAEAVTAAVGLSLRDLMPEPTVRRVNRSVKPRPSRPAKPAGRAYATAEEALGALESQLGPHTALWNYHDVSGKLVGFVARWDRTDGGKEIRPGALHADGWRVSAMPEPRPLYRLPELAAATRVVVVEGEKAAEAARSLGLTATTCAGGSLASGKADWMPLAGKDVWLLPDNDAPGRNYAEAVANTLAGLAPPAVVRVVELPSLPDKGDIVEWIEEAHGDAAEPEAMRGELEALALAVPPWRVAGPTAGATSAGWSDPVPLTPAFDPPPFPIEVLPEWGRSFAEAVAEEKQVPVDLPALLTLGAVAGGIARKVVVTPWDGWNDEPTNLFVMCALPPGERKSQTFAAVFAPVCTLERLQREAAEPGVREAEGQLSVAQKRVDHLEGKLVKAEDASERDRLKSELRTAREELAAVTVLVMPLLRVDDDTPEMLAKELVTQRGRLLAASPEARTIENISRYSDSPNMDVFLKGHAGDDLRSGRVGRGRDAIDRPALTCVFTPQPCVLESLGETAELRGRGFLARWLYSLPKSIVGYRKPQGTPVPRTVKMRYEAALTAAWRLDYADAANDTPHVLHFTPAAVEVLLEFERWKEDELRPGGLLAGGEGWGNKLGGLCVRLCGLFHVADGLPATDTLTAPIGADVVRRVVALCKDYAVPHARAAFAQMGDSPAVAGAKKVLKWLGSRDIPTAGFSKREAFNGCRGTFPTVDELQPALDLLERHYLIRPQQLSPAAPASRGRPASPVYEVNPAAFRAATAAQNAHKPQ
ncbi:MAG: DUF3987 domain-containing protein [Gemmataceae bacterium]